MANKVLGIEIGQNLTRVVEIDYKVKNPKIYNIFSIPTPPGMITDGVAAADTMFRSLLGSKLKEKRITTNKVIFILNSTRIASREVEADQGNAGDERIGLFPCRFKPVQVGT